MRHFDSQPSMCLKSTLDFQRNLSPLLTRQNVSVGKQKTKSCRYSVDTLVEGPIQSYFTAPGIIVKDILVGSCPVFFFTQRENSYIR